MVLKFQLFLVGINETVSCIRLCLTYKSIFCRLFLRYLFIYLFIVILFILRVKGNCLDGMVCALTVETPPPMMMTPPQPDAPLLPPTSGTAPPPDQSNTPPPPNRALTPSPNGSKKIVEELPIILEATIQIFLLSLLFTYF
jgi:hypothetical protein